MSNKGLYPDHQPPGTYFPEDYEESDSDTLKELQKREQELWDSIESEASNSMIGRVVELIDVNIEIEKHCNQ